MIKSYLNSMGRSERYRLVVAFAVITSLLFYLVLWRPVSKNHEALSNNLEQKEALLNWMIESSAVINSNKRAGVKLTSNGLQRLISERAGHYRIDINRIQSLTDDRVQMELNHVAFNSLLELVSSLVERGAFLEQFIADRSDVTGNVSAKIIFRIL